MPEIILKNITKRFGKSVAVDNLNLVIKDGDFVSLLGPSGCGKTTTLRMIAGLETPTEGEIYIDGKLVFSSEKGVDVSPDKRNVGSGNTWTVIRQSFPAVSSSVWRSQELWQPIRRSF